MKEPSRVQVWCDVGGTFTDCIIAMPDGSQRSCKVLSHGNMLGRIDAREDDGSFWVQARQSDPSHFWEPSIVYAIDGAGQRSEPLRCVRFEQGQFWLDGLLPANAFQIEIETGLEAPVLATRLLLGCRPTERLPPLSIRFGTTRGTNALLTRNGAKTAFVTTEGFADLLKIGFQERPELFQLNVCKRKPLYHSVAEVRERLDATGRTLVPLDESMVFERLNKLYEEGYRSLAVCLIHAYCNPEHEKRVGEIARQIGFASVCLSHEVAPMIKAVSRGETTVVDAYLTPIVQGYIQKVREQFQQNDADAMMVMSSAGGLVPAEQYRGRDSVLSGPAGGAVALQAISKSVGISPLIGLDMGGTSTDVCRVDGDLDLDFETIKAGVRMMAPTLRIHTVAAGGGSICWFDGVQLRVGPQSAGSQPGPACYGRGGPLTVTDLNLLTGRIDASSFPFPLKIEAAEKALQAVLDQMATTASSLPMDRVRLIDGFRKIANEHMASAVRSISIAQGADPRKHTLVAFGGAAGQHICEIAENLGMHEILDPPAAGLLSAVGMGMACKQRSSSLPVYQSISNLADEWLESAKQQLQLKAEIDVIAEAGPSPTYRIEARYQGTDGTISVPCLEDAWDPTRFVNAFEQLHRAKFGYVRANRTIEIAVIHAIYRWDALNVLPKIPLPTDVIDANHPEDSIDREKMIVGQAYAGPLLVRSSGSTTFIDQSWQGIVLADRTILLRRSQQDSLNVSNDRGVVKKLDQRQVDPVLREVLAQRVAAIAEQMGTVLEQTAISVNIKERRDFSCAVFNCRGELIANAPHVPVHLGAMSATVQQMIAKFPEMQRGDCFITNDPYQGGSHLPDVTVVTPVFASTAASSAAPDFFVACRGHHAEIGGIAPGSMAPTSTNLAQEGVLIPPMHIARAGEDCTSSIEALLRNARYPSRNVVENLADIAAQQSANQLGVTALIELASEVGVETLQCYMEHIQLASQSKTEAWLKQLENRVYRYRDHMDDGTAICVAIQVHRESDGAKPRLIIDFAGTGKESIGNLNANPAIVSAAVLYVIRCAIADELPLNSGVMRSVELRVPHGILNPQRRSVCSEPSTIGPTEEAEYWPAVAGGNVETSQRVVDCLLGALELAAASQGTMNNFLFGNHSFGYYETIGGGSGATSTADGEDAVHTHMTNTRLTDVEILEKKYPVRLLEFAVRTGSGGSGRYRGGCGLVRQVQALTPLNVSLVTSRRGTYLPAGLAGGDAGACGENCLIRKDGTRERLGSSVQLTIEAGDSIRLLTPGGGGYGAFGAAANF
ncbi:MAG: hydantoinase B/oxoprolinase family protein [Pirellula sp.]